MATEVLDCTGMRCPQPVLKVATKSASMKSGDLLEVLGDCPTFERDLRAWCQRTNKTLLSVVDEGGPHRAQIQF